MFQYDIIQSGLVLLALLAVGEFISRKLKSAMPAILISGIIFIVLLWTGVLPHDIIESSGYTSLTTVAISLVIVSMGSSTNFAELRANAKTVALAASVFFFQVASVLLVMSLVYDTNTAIGSLPGGSNVSIIIQSKARELGYENIVVLSVLLFSLKAFVSAPIVTLAVRKEVKRICAGGTVPPVEGADYTDAPPGLSESFLSKIFYKGPCRSDEPFYLTLLRMYFVAWIAGLLEILTGLSRYVYCLLLGILFTELGFLHKNDLKKTGMSDFLILLLMVAVMKGFTSATPEMISNLIVPVAIVLFTEALSIFIFSRLLGKAFGFSPHLSAAIGYQGMMGFPLNLMIAQDVINAEVEDEQLRDNLNSEISTRVVLAGFTNTTILSVIVAGILIGFMR